MSDNFQRHRGAKITINEDNSDSGSDDYQRDRKISKAETDKSSLFLVRKGTLTSSKSLDENEILQVPSEDVARQHKST